ILQRPPNESLYTPKNTKIILWMVKRHSILLALALTLAVASIGTLLNEFYLHFLFTRPIVIALIVIGIAGGIYAKIFKPKITIVSFICLGLFLIPYFSFAFGRSDFYMRDEEGDFMEGVTVKEVRVHIVKLEFHEANKDVWVTGLEDGRMTLYVGQNWAWLGTINIPNGRIDKVRRVFNIEVELEIDKTKMEHWAPPEETGWITTEETSTMIKGYFDFSETQVDIFDEPAEIPFGHPDMGLDITLGEDGYPTKIYAHVFLPEPLGEQSIEIPIPPKSER
ncbi:MAG: hypothetical protein ACE5OT_05785, partial [Candidatus Hadarchaeaceae archaeon]